MYTAQGLADDLALRSQNFQRLSVIDFP